MKVIVLISGGLDSSVLLHFIKSQGHFPVGLSFNYGQRHKKELSHAAEQCTAAGAEHHIVDIRGMAGLKELFAGSALLDESIDVPLGHYESESMRATVVPNRNMILLSLATAFAIQQKAPAIAIAAHAGDHAIYPDCRPEFLEAMAGAIAQCDEFKVALWRPFVKLTKAEIVELGIHAEVDFLKTWSCYQGDRIHCGQCGTCVERREAFALAGVEDPTMYVDEPPLPTRPAESPNVTLTSGPDGLKVDVDPAEPHKPITMPGDRSALIDKAIEADEPKE